MSMHERYSFLAILTGGISAALSCSSRTSWNRKFKNTYTRRDIICSLGTATSIIYFPVLKNTFTQKYRAKKCFHTSDTFVGFINDDVILGPFELVLWHRIVLVPWTTGVLVEIFARVSSRISALLNPLRWGNNDKMIYPLNRTFITVRNRSICCS